MKKIIFTITTLLILSLVLCSTGCRKRRCGEPRQNCNCTEDYRPVCGSDNKTYSNACMAECAGITSYVRGECQIR